MNLTDERIEAVARAIEQAPSHIAVATRPEKERLMVAKMAIAAADEYSIDAMLDATHRVMVEVLRPKLDEAYERGWRDAMSQDNPPMNKEQDNG